MLKPKSKSEVKSAESHRRLEDVGLSNEASFRELAMVILKFGVIYLRIERWKQQQMMEPEKQRIGFTKRSGVSKNEDACGCSVGNGEIKAGKAFQSLRSC